MFAQPSSHSTVRSHALDTLALLANALLYFLRACYGPRWRWHRVLSSKLDRGRARASPEQPGNSFYAQLRPPIARKYLEMGERQRRAEKFMVDGGYNLRRSAATTTSQKNCGQLGLSVIPVDNVYTVITPDPCNKVLRVMPSIQAVDGDAVMDPFLNPTDCHPAAHVVSHYDLVRVACR